jgi:hypothetical protein
MRKAIQVVLVLGALLGCGANQAAPPGGSQAAQAPPPGRTMDVTGTVRWNGLEAGFWTIVADGGASYDTHDLPAAFRKDGLRVAATLRLRPDLSCFHMAGPIAEVVSIRKV